MEGAALSFCQFNPKTDFHTLITLSLKPVGPLLAGKRAVVLMRLVLRHQVPIARQILYGHVVVVEDLIDKVKLPAEEIFFVVDEGSDTFHLVS